MNEEIRTLIDSLRRGQYEDPTQKIELLSAALRENLKRRKQQLRGRADRGAPDGGEDDGAKDEKDEAPGPAGSWEAAVSHVEMRLDRLSFDWRAHILCRRP